MTPIREGNSEASGVSQDMAHIPGREHYDASYIAGGREFSLAHQLSTIHRFAPKSVVEIGPGPGLATRCMRAVGIEVTTVDVQEELAPDVTASVLDLPFEDRSFDAALCCQVLEHLPFDTFTTAIRELGRVARKGIVLSLPDVSACVYLAWGLRRTGVRSRHLAVPGRHPGEIPESRLESMGHYWEIGYKGTEKSTVRSAIVESGMRVERDWRVPELPWHRFFEIRQQS